eukprot:scaffold5479_cov199-Amphora_coffeaeformis.AAC.95
MLSCGLSSCRQVSHLVLGHISLANEIDLGLKTTEIVLLSLDPTAGLVTFAIVGILSFARKAIEMSYSRKHEHEADELGLKLLAECGHQFDLEAGAKFLYRMHNAEESNGKTGWLDSHPASLERARQIYQESKKIMAAQQPPAPKNEWMLAYTINDSSRVLKAPLQGVDK